MQSFFCITKHKSCQIQQHNVLTEELLVVVSSYNNGWLKISSHCDLLHIAMLSWGNINIMLFCMLL